MLGIWGHLTSRRRIQLGLLLVVMLLSGMAELVSLGAVLPFLSFLVNPEQLWQQLFVQDLAAWLGINTSSELLLPITLAFALASITAAFIRIANLWMNGRFAAAVGSDLSCEAYRLTLFQPYSVHLQRNSSSVITTITTHIGQTVAALKAVLLLLTAAMVAVGLITGLLLIDPQVAIAAASLFGCAYALLAIVTRRQLLLNSQKIAAAATLRLKALQEGLGAIRDVLLDGSQSTYIRIYRQADRPQRQFQAKNEFIGSFPRYSFEALGMLIIALIGGVLVQQRGSGEAVIPLLGVLALGAQRLLPAMQQIYSGWSVLKSFNVSLQAVLDMLNQPLPNMVGATEPLPLREGICLEGVNFHYGPDLPDVLQNLDLCIRRGERIGLIGSTGSGKSTTLDLLMGLLKPSAGRVLVDGVDLYDPAHPERLAAWRAAIAHVPQTIYLADCSIAENIAFGLPKHAIDISRVKQAAEQAQIADFIESSSDGYASFVGERGIRLSGGQRQRIGIARALYKQASVIILDEATSALDTSTEQAVMAAVENLSRNLTIVMIAHRLSTVQRCDRVVRIEKGRVLASGTPSMFLQSNG